MKTSLTASFLTLGLTASFTFLMGLAPLLNAAETSPAAPYSEPKTALAGIPREVLQDMRPNSRNLGDAVVKANSIVEKNVKGKPAVLKMVVRRVDQLEDPQNPGQKILRVIASTEQIRESGVSLAYYTRADMHADEKEKVLKLKEGSKVTVTGQINGAMVMDRQGPELHIYLENAKFK